MKTIKIIDLLNKIANGEEVPKEIKFDGELCSFDNEDKDYYCEQYGNIVWYLVDTRNNMSEVLDTEVEIIEEDKKIEKLITLSGYDSSSMQRHYVKINEVCNKINEIIDRLNEMDKGE